MRKVIIVRPRGRPTVYGSPMTAAERKRRSRAMKALDKPIEVEKPGWKMQWRLCLWCFEPFQSRENGVQKYCTPACRKASESEDFRVLRPQARKYYSAMLRVLRECGKETAEGFAVGALSMPEKPPELNQAEKRLCDRLGYRIRGICGKSSSRYARVILDRLNTVSGEADGNTLSLPAPL